MTPENYNAEAMASDVTGAIREALTDMVVSDLHEDWGPWFGDHVVFYVDTPGGKRFTFTVTESTDIQR